MIKISAMNSEFVYKTKIFRQSHSKDVTYLEEAQRQNAHYDVIVPLFKGKINPLTYITISGNEIDFSYGIDHIPAPNHLEMMRGDFSAAAERYSALLGGVTVEQFVTVFFREDIVKE